MDSADRSRRGYLFLSLDLTRSTTSAISGWTGLCLLPTFPRDYLTVSCVVSTAVGRIPSAPPTNFPQSAVVGCTLGIIDACYRSSLRALGLFPGATSREDLYALPEGLALNETVRTIVCVSPHEQVYEYGLGRRRKNNIDAGFVRMCET